MKGFAEPDQVAGDQRKVAAGKPVMQGTYRARWGR
jgi:hypothetical protein